MNPMFSLKDRVALVTGSTKGIGKAIAQSMAIAGAKMVISSRTPEAVQAVTEEFRASGFEAMGCPCDVGIKSDLERLVSAAVERWGRIDCLVCNAAIDAPLGPLSEVTDDAVDWQLTVNVKSVLWLANLVLPQMATRSEGSMTIISSIAALRGSSATPFYSATKLAEVGLARALAVEWGSRNIRVNCILPGVIKTDMGRTTSNDDARLARRLAITPLKRLGEPDDIAGIAVFLASQAAKFITGQMIVADGGASIGW